MNITSLAAKLKSMFAFLSANKNASGNLTGLNASFFDGIFADFGGTDASKFDVLSWAKASGDAWVLLGSGSDFMHYGLCHNAIQDPVSGLFTDTYDHTSSSYLMLWSDNGLVNCYYAPATGGAAGTPTPPVFGTTPTYSFNIQTGVLKTNGLPVPEASINLLTGKITGIVGPDGKVASGLALTSSEQQAPGTLMVDWAGVTIGSTTSGWTVTKDASKTFGGKTTLAVTATAGAADTLVCSITVPATYLGGARRIAYSVATADSYLTGDLTNPVQLWLNLSGSTTQRITSYAYASQVPGDWSEGVVFSQDASASGHITGTTQWGKLAAENFTTIQLVMTKRAGQAITSALHVGPIYTDPTSPATLTIFMDGQYSGQYAYARQVLQAYNFKASLAILPYWINDYPTIGNGPYAGTMTLAQMLQMYALGHEFIGHTGLAGPSGHVDVGWDDTTKYPDPAYATVLADVQAINAFMTANNATRGLGYGVVGFTNGLVNTQALSRRASISQALVDAGYKKVRQLGTYVGNYYGDVNESTILVTPGRMVVSADSAATIEGIVDQIVARGGWASLTFHDFTLPGASSGNNIGIDTFEAIMAYIFTKVSAGTLRVKLFSDSMLELQNLGIPL